MRTGGFAEFGGMRRMRPAAPGPGDDARATPCRCGSHSPVACAASRFAPSQALTAFPQPDDADRALWLRAQRRVAARDWDAAQADFLALLDRHPALLQARLLLAGVLLAQQRVRDAAQQLALAATNLPGDAGAIHRVAQTLARLGETRAALACLRHPAVAQSRSPSTLLALAHVFQGIGLHAESLALMDRARDLGLDSADFRYFRALQLQFNGRLDDAEREMEACLRAGPTFGRASLSLARIRRQTPARNHVDFIRRRLRSVAQGSEDHAAFEFALYEELEDLGHDEEAWQALLRGNAIMRRRIAYDEDAEEALFEAVIERFDAGFLAKPAPAHAGPMPIFIVGMPRSGTTLLERILGSHPMVASAGELTDLPRQLRWVADRHGHALLDQDLLAAAAHIDDALLGRRYLEQSQWRAAGRSFYVDKLPHNFLLAGFIRRALPQVKLVHVVREPVDVCFSNFRALFGDAYGYSYALESLAHHHGLYRRLMRHWREVMPDFILDVSYADLVQDTEATCRRLLAFCGLPFAPGCLDHTRNTASVATLSSAQVRQPIHTRAVGAWRRYEGQLQPLQALLSAQRTS